MVQLFSPKTLNTSICTAFLQLLRHKLFTIYLKQLQENDKISSEHLNKNKSKHISEQKLECNQIQWKKNPEKIWEIEKRKTANVSANFMPYLINIRDLISFISIVAFTSTSQQTVSFCVKIFLRIFFLPLFLRLLFALTHYNKIIFCKWYNCIKHVKLVY